MNIKICDYIAQIGLKMRNKKYVPINLIIYCKKKKQNILKKTQMNQ